MLEMGRDCKADDDSRDDGEDEENEDEDEEMEAAVDDDSNGVDSDGGGIVVLVFASRLQMGQNVLHEVSQVSTQTAWNSVETRHI